jgi:hypothetical protein
LTRCTAAASASRTEFHPRQLHAASHGRNVTFHLPRRESGKGRVRMAAKGFDLRESEWHPGNLD